MIKYRTTTLGERSYIKRTMAIFLEGDITLWANTC